MSGEVTTKKRKSKGKKKDEPTDDMAHLIEENEGGSGCCAKLLFLLLISAFGVAAGVVFFELGGTNGPLSELPSLPKLPDLPDLPSLSSLPSFSDIEKYINDIKAPWFDSEPPTTEPPVEQPPVQEPEVEFIEPTPAETETDLEEPAVDEPAAEEPAVHEAAQLVQSPPEEIIEVTTEAPEIATEPSIFEEPEVVSETPQEEPQLPAEEVSETPVEEVTPVAEEAPEAFAMEEATKASVVQEASDAPVVEEASETPVVEEASEAPFVEEASETPVVEETTETPVVEEASDAPVVEEASEAPVVEEATLAPVVEEANLAPVVEEATQAPVDEEASEAPVVKEATQAPVVEEASEAPVVEETSETPAVEKTSETPAVEETSETPAVEEAPETPVIEEVSEIPAIEEAPETPVIEEVSEIPAVEEAPETPVVEEVAEAPFVDETAVVEEAPIIAEATEALAEQVSEAPSEETTSVEEVADALVEETTAAPVEEVVTAPVGETIEDSHFEQQLEDDTAEVPQESFTMRAEREAVQEAVDNVWVLTVRCIEELRALQTVAKASQTLKSVDEISTILEPLRFELDTLVRSTSDNDFDGALEKAADLERRLRAVLDALDEARNLDDVFAATAEEELASQQAEESEPTQESEEIIADAEPQVESAPAEPLPIEVVADEVTPQSVEESAAEQVLPEPTIAVEIVEQSEPPVVEETTEQIAEIPVAAEEVSEQAPQEVPAVLVEEVLVPSEEVSQLEEQAPVDVVSEPEPIQTAEEQIPEAAAVIQPVEEQQVDPQVSESVPEQPEESSPPVSPESPVEPQESQPVEEPVQVAEEAFVVGPAEGVSPPAAGANPSVIQNLEETDRLVDQSPGEALKLMEQILEVDPAHALALYGRARSLDTLAELERSNARLEQAIFAYRAVLDLEDRVGDDLYRKAALRCIDRMRFRGFHGKAIRIQQRMVARFPDDIDLQNQLAVSFLITNQPEAAKTIVEGVLQRWPQSGFAQVHLGFILKTTYDDYEAGAHWMRSGIDTRDDGVTDGRFYFHLGDALIRLGRREEAQQVFIEGEKAGVFLSRDQRSLYNVDRLTGKPWWDKESTTYGPFFNLMEANWQSIRDEGVALLDLNPPEGFADETEKLKNTGDWKQFELFVQGRKNVANCEKAPKTCALIENYPPALCKRGQVKFSVMHPGTHVWPHTGPTNCRIRAHLGLVVPEGLALRVANETRTWEEGKFIVFDDSFEHEVWHNGSSYRLVLIIDLWHPELTPEERRSLPAI